MDSLFVCLVMLALVTAMVVARLWVEGRMQGSRDEANGEAAPGDQETDAEGWEDKGEVWEWWS